MTQAPHDFFSGLSEHDRAEGAAGLMWLSDQAEAFTGLKLGGTDPSERAQAWLERWAERGWGAFGTHLELALAFSVLLASQAPQPAQLSADGLPQELGEMIPDDDQWVGAALRWIVVAAPVPRALDFVARCAVAGRRLDVPDAAGRTPLHHATIAGRERVVQALLAAGVDPNQPDARAHTAADWALRLQDEARAAGDAERGAAYDQVLEALQGGPLPRSSVRGPGSRRLS